MRDFRVYLDDILDAINNIEKYTNGFTFETFVKDKKTVDAVIRNFEIIGYSFLSSRVVGDSDVA